MAPTFNMYLKDGLDNKVQASVQGMAGDFLACVVLENRQFRKGGEAPVCLMGSSVARVETHEVNKICCSTPNANMLDGPNRFKVSALDTNGKTLAFQDTIWCGAVQQKIFVRDAQGTALPGANLFMTLADDNEVGDYTFKTDSLGGGLAPYVPRERVYFVSGFHGTGMQANVEAFFGPIELSWGGPLGGPLGGGTTRLPISMNLEGPSPPSLVSDNNDLSKGKDGWEGTQGVDFGITDHRESTRFLRNLATDKDIYICTGNSANLETVRMKRAVSVLDPVAAGAKNAEVRFRFATNDIDDRNGYHVRLLARDANNNGYEYFVANSGYGLINSGGDPFNWSDPLMGPGVMSSKWLTTWIELAPDTVAVELIVTVYTKADPVNQPLLRSCVTVDYLKMIW